MFAQAYAVVTVHVRLSSVLIGILLPDLALTCAAAAAERQPRLLLFAPFYPVMRLVDAAIGLSAIPVAWLTRASGRWRSPARREIHAGPGAVLPAAAVPAAAVPAAVPQAAVLRAAVPAAAAPHAAGPHANAGDGSHAARR
jgi:hypothetical protein